MSGTSSKLGSVYFVDANNGYVVGDFGTILKTTNAGNTWQYQTSGTVENLHSVRFTDANNGYTVGQCNTILKTTNAGNTWTHITGPGNALKSVYFVNSTIGYAVGGAGTIEKTTNAGIAWTSLSSGTTQQLESVYFCNANNGFVVGWNGTILKTIDGGVGIEERKIINNNQIILYPNPASDILTLKTANVNNTELTLDIYTGLGELISTEIIRQNQQPINIGYLPNGIYMVCVKSKEWSENQKLVIQR